MCVYGPISLSLRALQLLTENEVNLTGMRHQQRGGRVDVRRLRLGKAAKNMTSVRVHDPSVHASVHISEPACDDEKTYREQC